jgi:hypothetical protein
MAKGIMPGDPNRADHRFIAYQLDNFMKPKCLHLPKEFDRVARAFARAGGSWERLFRGSARDVVLLRKILKLAVKHGYVTKEPSFR